MLKRTVALKLYIGGPHKVINDVKNVYTLAQESYVPRRRRGETIAIGVIGVILKRIFRCFSQKLLIVGTTVGDYVA